MTIAEKLNTTIRTIPDYPKPGILFRDITTLLNNARAFGELIEHLKARYAGANLDFIAGIESRGFMFAAPLAVALGVGFVPLRKKGKLPHTTLSQKYSLEYGFDEVEMHVDAFGEKAGARVLLVDDLIATGGTAIAGAKLIESAGGKCVEACFILRLKELNGSAELSKIAPVYAVLDC